MCDANTVLGSTPTGRLHQEVTKKAEETLRLPHARRTAIAGMHKGIPMIPGSFALQKTDKLGASDLLNGSPLIPFGTGSSKTKSDAQVKALSPYPKIG